MKGWRNVSGKVKQVFGWPWFGKDQLDTLQATMEMLDHAHRQTVMELEEAILLNMKTIASLERALKSKDDIHLALLQEIADLRDIIEVKDRYILVLQRERGLADRERDLADQERDLASQVWGLEARLRG